MPRISGVQVPLEDSARMTSTKTSRKRKRFQEMSDNQDMKQDGSPVTKITRKDYFNDMEVSTKGIYKNQVHRE